MGRLFLYGFVIGGGDGHTRITRGEDFCVAGGSAGAHEFTADVAQEAAREAGQAGTLREAARAVREVVERRAAEAGRR